MKIVFDARLVQNHLTGIGRYVVELLQALTTEGKDHNYVIWINDMLDKEHTLYKLGETEHNVTIKTKDIATMGVSQQVFLAKHLRLDQPDIYHYPHYDMPYVPKIKSIATVHDLKYLLYPHFFPEFSKLKKTYTKVMMKRTLLKSERVIAVSNSTKNDLIKVFGKQYENKINVILEAAEDRYEKQISDHILWEVKERYQLPDDFIFFLGEKRPHKNIIGLIRAFEMVCRNPRLDNFRLVISGNQYKEYNEIIDTNVSENIRDKILFTGYVEDQDLPCLYTLAKLFVLPSYYEGFGIPLLEAMSCGTPVITSNISSMPEITGNAALLVNPNHPNDIAEAITKILTDKELYLSLQEKARQRASMFSWKTTARQTLKLYESVLEDGGVI